MKGIAVVAVLLCIVLLVGCGSKTPPEPPIDPVEPAGNHAPVNLGPFWTESSIVRGAKLTLDFRYRQHGCSASGDVMRTGIYDPDGDDLMYSFVVRDAAGPFSLFRQDGTKIEPGDWITFPKVQGEDQAIIVVFLGWREETTPYPLAPKACNVLLPPVEIVSTVRDSGGKIATRKTVLSP